MYVYEFHAKRCRIILATSVHRSVPRSEGMEALRGGPHTGPDHVIARALPPWPTAGSVRAAFFTAGLLACEVLNLTLKHTIRHPRPKYSPYKGSAGSHAAVAGMRMREDRL